jgi:hypothetical protein
MLSLLVILYWSSYTSTATSTSTRGISMISRHRIFSLPRISQRLMHMSSADSSLSSHDPMSISSSPNPTTATNTSIPILTKHSSILMMPFQDLSTHLGGTGRARLFWHLIRQGIDPLQHEGIGDSTLSFKVKDKVKQLLNNNETNIISTSVIIEETLSSCGTRKFLSRLVDNNTIESVLIPSYKFERTTLCISTQIGCDRRCAFCATGNTIYSPRILY